MYKLLLTSCLILICMPLIADKDDAGEEYRSWCTRSAEVEKIALTERPEFIQECIDTLVDADKRQEDSDR
ncbi:MAG: hypothetical protein B6D71_10300 [gamma proteobacterium symbiont of Stewartia floridana]|nr:MAG: hypothetical protein B6D73_15555 [gamma proteobacterium symbiont of Stewartia floridana]RLW69449.1 MAG: hypothetical protein B6D71_10300 [gamma proteobacterium symbiont of Stewartia floridana]